MFLRTGSHVRCSVSRVLSAAGSVIAFSLNGILCTPSYSVPTQPYSHSCYFYPTRRKPRPERGGFIGGLSR